jgi:hypothetical protein
MAFTGMRRGVSEIEHPQTLERPEGSRLERGCGPVGNALPCGCASHSSGLRLTAAHSPRAESSSSRACASNWAGACGTYSKSL